MSRRLGAGLALLVALAGCSGGEERPAAGCTPPPDRIVPAPLEVTNLLRTGPRTAMDTDGDGRPDQVGTVPGGITVARTDGTLTLAAAGQDVSLLTWGDLDGDGRDDLLLSVDAGPDHQVRAVTGRTEPGRRDPRRAGVRVDDELTSIWLQDLDGRAGADFVVLHRGNDRSTTDVWSGAAVLGRRPGGDARQLPRARRLRGLVRGVAALAPGGPDETILFEPGRPAALRFASRPRLVLRALGPAARVEDLAVFERGGRRWIGLTVDRRVALWAVPHC
jgi:hypothetical protein